LGVSELTVLDIVALCFFSSLEKSFKASNYKQEVYHFNAHSGYPPICLDSTAIFYMCTLLGYTVILYVTLAL